MFCAVVMRDASEKKKKMPKRCFIAPRGEEVSSAKYKPWGELSTLRTFVGVPAPTLSIVITTTASAGGGICFRSRGFDGWRRKADPSTTFGRKRPRFAQDDNLWGWADATL